MKSLFMFSLLLAVTMLAAHPAHAAVQRETVEYDAFGVTGEGYFAWDDAFEGPRPAVLVVHQYQGPGAYERKRADMLAELGYLAFVCDIYGKETRPNGHEAGLAEVGKYYGDRGLFRQRLLAGYVHMLGHPLVDMPRVAAIGYCFGGTGVLELARAGCPMLGVVSFHGNLDTTMPIAASGIKSKILVLTGAIDPFVPQDQVMAFEDEMNAAGADWQLVKYSGALHAFTMWDMNMPGMAQYNAAADRRSWQAMQDFLAEVFE